MAGDIHERLLLIRKRTRILQRREEHVADVKKAFDDVIKSHRGNLHALELRDPDPDEDAFDVLNTIRLLVRKVAALEEKKKAEVKRAQNAVDVARERQHAAIFSDQLDLFAGLDQAKAEDEETEEQKLSVVRVSEAGELVVEEVTRSNAPKAQSARVPHDPDTGEVLE